MNLLNGSSRRRASGQSLTEFALIFPVLILVIVAVFDVGRGIFAYNTLSDAARQGTRHAIVNQTESEVKQKVLDLANAAGLGLTSADVGVTYEGSPCSPVKLGCVAVVTVEYEYVPLTPIIDQILDPITLRAESKMPVENI